MDVVILGGTGYIGRAVTQKWLKSDTSAKILTVSRSGENKLKDPRIVNLKADCTDLDAVRAVLPEKIDVIIDLVGGMGDPEENIAPARVTASLAELLDIPKIGYVGGVLGSKEFVASKKEAAQILLATGRDVVIVEPTLVYGNGRSDSLTKMVPLLKFLGLFSKKYKPVTVESVADELVSGLLKGSAA